MSESTNATDRKAAGTIEVTSNAVDAAVMPTSSIESMRMQLRSLGQVELERSERRLQAIRSAQRLRRKDELLDLLVVGGITLGAALRDPGGVPADVTLAFELAYPGLAQIESFANAVSHMSSDELVGLVSGVKGKLFELELVEHLNNGNLPDGFHAAMAQSATQPGWDIQITDANGLVSERLLAKANETASNVQDALERYPGIDVTTIIEVHAQLVAMGVAQDVHNISISEAFLRIQVEAAARAGNPNFAIHLVPSSIGLAVIALSVFMDRGATLREISSSTLGELAILATQTWWLGLIAGVGSSWLASSGHGKREQYEALRATLSVVRQRHVAMFQV